MLGHCSILPNVHKKGLSLKAMHDDFVTTLDPDAMTYRTVARHVHDAKGANPKATSPQDRISRQFDESDQAILLGLEEQPFSSVRELSRATHLSRMTVYRRLTGWLNCTVRHLRCVTDLLSDAAKAAHGENF
jgi:hypothetical protein